MRTAKTARSAVDVMTAVVAVVDLEVVTTAVARPRAVTAPEVADSARVQAVDSAHVVKAAPRAVMAMTAADLRAVLEIVTAVTVAARRSASGWRSRRMCR